MLLSRTTYILCPARRPPCASLLAHRLNSFERQLHSLRFAHVGPTSGLLQAVEERLPRTLPLLIELDRHDGRYRLAVALHDIAVTLGDDLVQDLAELSSRVKGTDFPF